MSSLVQSKAPATCAHLSTATMSDLTAKTGQVIECKAAVAWEMCKPLDVCTILVDPPKRGEVRVKVLTNALCHTDLYTLNGDDPEGLFPCILGHEAACVVESVGEGVTSVAPGDIVIACYTPECGQETASCMFCESEETNLCPKIRATQGKGLMPDKTSRFHSKDGKMLYHFMGCSTFSEYTVLSEISCAKINPMMSPKLGCLLGCGIATGWGAVFNTCKVRPGSSVIVFGLGAVGLSVVQAARIAGARYIVGVDINNDKEKVAKEFGTHDFVNPMEVDDIKKWLYERPNQKWGYDYTFDCTGNTNVMRTALEMCHRGWGQSCIIGVAKSGAEIATRPFNLVIGKKWTGTAFGGWKSRTEVPKLVQTVMRGEMKLDPFVTHNVHGLENVNDAIHALHGGKCLRAVVHIGDLDVIGRESYQSPTLLENKKVHGGYLKRMKHFSKSLQCDMTFSVFIPGAASRHEEEPAVMYFLSGLTCTDANCREKGNVFAHASKFNLAVVFPDTSPRGEDVPNEDSYDFGQGAGFYLNATTPTYKKNYRMEEYVTQELPALVNSLFAVNSNKVALSGHSMGGHGALSLALRHPDMYQSVTAFSPICNPTKCPWGQKAFNGYLGSVEAGASHDATELMKNLDPAAPRVPILIDQGTADQFLERELMPQSFKEACLAKKYPCKIRMQGGYDHSYYFISTFMEDHVKFHAKNLGLTERKM